MLPAYEIRRVVGQGGMGTVCEAVQRDLQRRVAIELLSPAIWRMHGLAGQFRYESRLMASLQHPGIVQVHEAGETAEGHLSRHGVYRRRDSPRGCGADGCRPRRRWVWWRMWRMPCRRRIGWGPCTAM